MGDLRTSASINIHAPIEEVWRALTVPDLIKRWFFGVDTDTTWEVGSPIVHRGEYQGQPYEDKGKIVRFEPPGLLVHTHWSDRSSLPDLPEHYQEVSWSLVERDNATELTVAEWNLPSEEAKAVSEQNWPMALQALRDLLEAAPFGPAAS
jgi:uncharacterized protein YndB with AHSA1/START domain